ncbi:MAG: AraC family transcriptional regulator [Methylacidiphilales bacterium]|nr:AraC family transcriptional regulator [Candidatus Methylacidiphilales bacterium]
MNGYKMRLLGFSMIGKGYHITRCCPDFSQIAVCYEGHGEILLNNSWKRWKVGTAFLTPPKTPHAYRAVAVSHWGVAWVIYGSSIVSSHSVTLISADPWPLRHAIEGLYRQTHHAPHSPAAHHWLELIHGYASQLAGPSPHQGQLTNVWSAVDAELARHWTLTDLASLANLSVEHLRRLTHEQHGRSPMHQVAYCRIQRAVSLLSRTDNKIESIARDVGFTSLCTFSVAFKRWIGMSPAAFRRKQS